MWKRLRGVPIIILAAWNLASCDVAPRKTANPVPEAEQVVGEAMRELYMAASAVPPHSPAQQKVILKMAEESSNGKELLLAMRAAVGVFPADAASAERRTEKQVQSIATAKMMEFGTLDQLIAYATQYSVDPASARPFVQRMFQLAQQGSEARDWYRIKAAAFHLKLGDLERQAQSRADHLRAGR
jgi:hypothetical protein